MDVVQAAQPLPLRAPTQAATMKEDGDWKSSDRRPPHGNTMFDDRSIIPEWASLPPELVERIADLVVSTTSGVDAYMDMRAVCSSWRSSISKPSPLVAVADIRFRPRQWVMLDLESKNNDEDARLFLHLPTGRFRRLHLPMLRNNSIVGPTDGLLVLDDREGRHLARVLNPLTRDMLHFPAQLYGHSYYTAVSGGSGSTLVLWLGKGSTVECADPNSDFFMKKDIGMYLMGMVTFQGNVYYARPDGWVFKLVRPTEQFHPELVAQMPPDMDILQCAQSKLVESDGQLLLIRVTYQALKVFRVDVKHKLLEEVKTLGRRALFISTKRCVSVDADKLPSVDGDCIYMFHWMETYEYRGNFIRMYSLRDAMDNISIGDLFERPFSLVQVLLHYCDSCFL